MAVWTTGQSIAPGPLRSAQLDVVVNGQLASVANLDATHVVTSWRVDDMLPGEFAGLSITATNGGSSDMPLDLRMDGYAEGALAGHFTVQVYEDATPTDTPPLTGVGSTTWRQSSCVGGTRLTSWIYLDSLTHLVPTKQRLNVGQSKTYCVLLALSGAAATYDNPGLLDGKGTVVFVLRGTQEGAP